MFMIGKYVVYITQYCPTPSAVSKIFGIYQIFDHCW